MTLNLQERVDILEARTDSLEHTLGALNLQERVGGLETKTDSLEDTLKGFITAVNRTMTRLENDTLNFRREMQDFRDNTERSLTRLENDTLNFRREMKDFKNEMKDFRNRTEADMKKFQRELREEAGRVDNKMGTLVEHMIAPGIPGIAKTYFGDDDLISFSIRVRRKSMSDPLRKREFDVIAFSEKNFYVTETKSEPELAKKFAEGLPELPDYFPECRGKNIIPIFSSLFIPENVKTFLTRRGIYAMGLHEDAMDLLNFDEVKREA
jgi:predicted  nucleic acid-binding Zn-ribbon protein